LLREQCRELREVSGLGLGIVLGFEREKALDLGWRRTKLAQEFRIALQLTIDDCRELQVDVMKVDHDRTCPDFAANRQSFD
jgi:hypothetical protein